MTGFTLPELLIATALITAIALLSTNTVIHLQKDMLLETTANEIVSTVRLAQAKSESGEIMPTEVASDFYPDTLPSYGVKSASNRYHLYRAYQKITDATPQSQTMTSFKVDSALTLDSFDLLFDRLTSNSPATTFLLVRTDGHGGRSISLDSTGTITLLKI